MNTRLIVVAALAMLITATAPALAQGQAAPADPPRHQAPAATAPTPSTPTPPAAMPMDMCRQMMAQMTSGGHESPGGMPMGMGPMMGGAPNHPMDPKAMAQMMEMRGEMMKAMGDIMMKHAKKLGGPPSR